MNEQHIEDLLRNALVGPHSQLYLTSPTFHAQIDHLVATLPIWVTGLAHEAKRVDAQQEVLIQILRTQTMEQRWPMQATDDEGEEE